MDNNNCCSLNGLKKKKKEKKYTIYFFAINWTSVISAKLLFLIPLQILTILIDQQLISNYLFDSHSNLFEKKKKLKNALSGKKKSNVSHNIKQNLTSCVKRHFWNLQMDFIKTKKLTSSLVRICKTAFSN